MASCPVEYVRCAKLRGTLFPSDVNEGVVSCADTGFWVDHSEPKEALRILKEEKRVEWPLGELPEGCEFLILAKVREKDCTGARGDDYKVKM
jgi:hypothetical protein